MTSNEEDEQVGLSSLSEGTGGWTVRTPWFERSKIDDTAAYGITNVSPNGLITLGIRYERDDGHVSTDIVLEPSDAKALAADLEAAAADAQTAHQEASDGE